MDPQRLAALTAVIDTGTFEAAAALLAVTSSAVSQRIRGLENEVGQVLVVRSTPCRPTAAGAVLVRFARQQQLLAAEALAEIRGPDRTTTGRTVVPIAVNADSLSTWFREVLTAIADWSDVLLDVRVEDQEHSAHLLRSGDVLAAVTSDPTSVQGCSTRPLTVVRYFAVAAPALVARYGGMGGIDGANGADGIDWAAMPLVRFNAKDDLQHRILARHAVADAPAHNVPGSDAFLQAIRAGLGWGVGMSGQIEPEIAAGRLVRLGPDDHVDVPLYWQRWKLRSDLLGRLTDAVVAAAGRAPRPTPDVAAGVVAEDR